MSLKRARQAALAGLLAFLTLSAPLTALADSGGGTDANADAFAVVTSYPSRVIGIGESVTLNLQLKAAPRLETVQLAVNDLPEGWTATFRGDGQIVTAVTVEPDITATVDLRLDPPVEVQPGAYHFEVLAQGGGLRAELPVDVTIKDRLPPSLSLSAQLPVLRGAPDTTFRYSVTLKNEGDDDLEVNLSAEAPDSFLVTFKSGGQEVTSLPLTGNRSETLSIEAKALGDVSAGTYPFTILAQGAEAQASLNLSAEVVGQAQLAVSAPDGRLSAQATAGRSSPIKLVVQNTGTAPVRALTLSSNEPTGWSVTFDTPAIDEIPAGQQVEVTAHVTPPDKAVAGDYVLTFSAKTAEGVSKSADFRVTVVTSTLWGITGIALIGVAVAVVGMAVVRFGRR